MPAGILRRELRQLLTHYPFLIVLYSFVENPMSMRTEKKRKQPDRRPTNRNLRVENLELRELLAADFAARELLIQYAPGQQPPTATPSAFSILETIHTKAMKEMDFGIMQVVQLPENADVMAAARHFSNQPGVLYAEPNWKLNSNAISNDPSYTNGSLWGMESDDSPLNIGPAGTTSLFGSQAEEAWNAGFTGSSNIVVGIVDEGVDINHPDLASNIWVNPYEVAGNGVDDDGNGYIDDINGWDFYYDDNTVYDAGEDSHGTHVAGTIGGVGGNGIGVAGVNWDVSMISTKFLGPGGGYTSDAIRAVDYLTDLKTRHGINIVASNNSWGGGGYSQALHDAILRHAKADILFVAAAGNSTSNNDATGNFPSNYSTLTGTVNEAAASYEGVIAVASITSSGAISSFSSYGATTVDIGAPGSSIISTVPNNSYATYSGTSMATPHVTGTVALYASKYPNASAAQIRNALLATATPTSSLAGKTVTGGRLNVAAALDYNSAPTPTISIGDASVTEGNSGTKTATFIATLSAASTSVVTVNFATANGTATAGSDYVASSGTLTFAPGETTKTINVTINGDTTFEANETYFVNLSSPSNATLNDSQGSGTIVNDDTNPVGVSINDVSITEGNRNTKNAIFTVRLSNALSNAVTVNFATANGSAAAGSDYTATSGSVRIRAGNTRATISVAIRGDTTVEANETFFVNITSVSGTNILDGQGVGTILNDDGTAGNGIFLGFSFLQEIWSGISVGVRSLGIAGAEQLVQNVDQFFARLNPTTPMARANSAATTGLVRNDPPAVNSPPACTDAAVDLALQKWLRNSWDWL
jgi:subtilisin family serine protease